jgi:hypothetical protein
MLHRSSAAAARAHGGGVRVRASTDVPSVCLGWEADGRPAPADAATDGKGGFGGIGPLYGPVLTDSGKGGSGGFTTLYGPAPVADN